MFLVVVAPHYVLYCTRGGTELAAVFRGLNKPPLPAQAATARVSADPNAHPVATRNSPRALPRPTAWCEVRLRPPLGDVVGVLWQQAPQPGADQPAIRGAAIPRIPSHGGAAAPSGGPPGANPGSGAGRVCRRGRVRGASGRGGGYGGVALGAGW